MHYELLIPELPSRFPSYAGRFRPTPVSVSKGLKQQKPELRHLYHHYPTESVPRLGPIAIEDGSNDVRPSKGEEDVNSKALDGRERTSRSIPWARTADVFGYGGRREGRRDVAGGEYTGTNGPIERVEAGTTNRKGSGIRRP